LKWLSRNITNRYVYKFYFIPVVRHLTIFTIWILRYWFKVGRWTLAKLTITKYKFHIIYWLFLFISEIQIYLIVINTLQIHFLPLIEFQMNSNQNHSSFKTQKQNAIRRQMKVLHISFTECVKIRHLQIATRVVTYTRYSCYERWFTYINPCQLESSRKTSGNVKLVNWTKENRKSRAENRLVKPRRILLTLTLWYSCSYAEQISKSNK
jgi:hypothetical protein